jgi:drug/metabolite transporter (DMT)-like permease
LPYEFVGPSFALAAAVLWGGADFSGGMGARGAHPVLVVVLSQMAGLACLLTFALAAGEQMPHAPALLWGGAAGVGASIGYLCFYRALAIGKMGINSPIAAIVTSGLSVVYSVAIFDQGLPTTTQLVGFAIALVAVWLMTVSSGETRGLGLAICAGLAFSAYLTCSKQATGETVFWPLVAARAAGVAVLAPALVSARVRERPASWWYIVGAGVLDAAANALFVYATRHGRLDAATILSAFYPAITVLCASVILHERATPLQRTGIAAALVAIPLIASH